MQPGIKKIAILQRVCTAYRLPLFRKLSTLDSIDVRLFIGESDPDSKVKNAGDLTGIKYFKFPTKFFALAGHKLVIQKGLMKELIKYNPDIIISEGASNLHSLIKAIIYRTIINRNAKLIHWSLGGLPGEKKKKNIVKSFLKKIIYSLVDGFLVYSTYGKNQLLNDGVRNDHISVAVNVSNVEKFIDLYNKNKIRRNEYRNKFNLGDSLTVLYVGDFSNNKRIDVIIDTANLLKNEDIKFILIGDGLQLERFKKMSEDLNLTNVNFTGRINEGLFEYYIASDVFMLPGRGGMVISEAMALGLPILVYQADGTEYDLVDDGRTGVIVPNGTPEEFADEIIKLSRMPEKVIEMGAYAHESIVGNFTLNNMVGNIIALVDSKTK